MPYLIDGHNLIPNIPGLHLHQLDDEDKLVEMLQTFSRVRRKGQIECFFDKAPAGQPRSQKIGVIQVRFAAPGATADGLIEARLDQLGKQARNYIVVSSDQRVRTAARSVGAQSIPSDIFARELLAALTEQPKRSQPSGKDNASLTPEEVDAWLEEFRRPRKNS
jgi:hypothetical protein